MDIELIGSYLLIIVLTLAGITGIIICITILKKTAKAEKVPAKIIGIKSRRGTRGTIERHFKYAVQITNDKVIELERLERISMIGYISDSLVIKEYLGKEIMVPYDRKNNKLFPHETIVETYLQSSIIVTTLGCVIILMLLLL